jgi:hypothetical protein
MKTLAQFLAEAHFLIPDGLRKYRHVEASSKKAAWDSNPEYARKRGQIGYGTSHRDVLTPDEHKTKVVAKRSRGRPEGPMHSDEDRKNRARHRRDADGHAYSKRAYDALKYKGD